MDGFMGYGGDASLCKVFRRIHEAPPAKSSRLQEVFYTRTSAEIEGGMISYKAIEFLR